MSNRLSGEDQRLYQHGVGKEGHPVADALCALVASRAADLAVKLLTESDPVEIHRLQGAAVELKRWAGYPEELARKVEWLDQPHPEG
jgi:hypothetical protein